MICAIVLAAGRSRRMGVQKLLLDYGGKSVISRIVEQLLDSVIDEVYVVVGHDRDRVAEESRGVSVVFNEDYKTGMLSSVRCGLRAIPETCRAVLVVLGDQPTITSKLVDEIVRAYAATEKGIVVPTYAGSRGHPLIISTRYRDRILTGYDDVGLRGLLHEHPGDVFELAVSTPHVCMDMDEPSDYSRAVDALRKHKQDKGG
jgi:molybdenum cofactor cytidylyltransferase